MIEFEWDDAKAAENSRKHGVSFELAAKAFRDPFGMEWNGSMIVKTTVRSEPSSWEWPTARFSRLSTQNAEAGSA